MAVAHRSYFQLQKNIKWKELLQKEEQSLLVWEKDKRLDQV